MICRTNRAAAELGDEVFADAGDGVAELSRPVLIVGGGSWSSALSSEPARCIIRLAGNHVGISVPTLERGNVAERRWA